MGWFIAYLVLAAIWSVLLMGAKVTGWFWKALVAAIVTTVAIRVIFWVAVGIAFALKLALVLAIVLLAFWGGLRLLKSMAS